MSNFKCHICHELKAMVQNSYQLYAELPGGHRICPDCLGRMDATNMILKGSAALYLTIVDDSKAYVSNFFGTIVFPVTKISKGKHNIAKTQTNIRFIGPDNVEWYGTNYGDETQVVHCARLGKMKEDFTPLLQEVYFRTFKYDPQPAPSIQPNNPPLH